MPVRHVIKEFLEWIGIGTGLHAAYERHKDWLVPAMTGALGPIGTWVASNFELVASQGWGALVFAGIAFAWAVAGLVLLAGRMRGGRRRGVRTTPRAVPDRAEVSRVGDLETFFLSRITPLKETVRNVVEHLAREARPDQGHVVAHHLCRAVCLSHETALGSVQRSLQTARAPEASPLFAVENELVAYHHAYLAARDGILETAPFLAVDLPSLGPYQEWREVDREYRRRLRDLAESGNHTVLEQIVRVGLLGTDLP